MKGLTRIYVFQMHCSTFCLDRLPHQLGVISEILVLAVLIGLLNTLIVVLKTMAARQQVKMARGSK